MQHAPNVGISPSSAALSAGPEKLSCYCDLAT